MIRYIAERNPRAAERVADRIEAAAVSLADFVTGRPGRDQKPILYVRELDRPAEARKELEAALAAPISEDWAPEDRRFKAQAKVLLSRLRG